jgi:hypothetical protein
MSHGSVETIYKNRIDSFSYQLKTTVKKINFVSNLRLAVVIVTVFLLYLFIKNGHQISTGITGGAGSAFFISLCIYHEFLFKRRNKLKNLVSINQDGVSRVTGNWSSFRETGEEFINDDHPYTSDLDIFGNSSLFQWINATNTFHGKQFLAAALRGENVTQEKIRLNQDAIKEIAPLIDLRQNVQEAGIGNKCSENPREIIDWSEKDQKEIIKPGLELFYKILPWLSLAAFISDTLFLKTIILPAVLYSIQIVLFGTHYLKSIKLFNIFENKANYLNSFASISRLFEAGEYSSELLVYYKKTLTDNYGKKASEAISEFSKIVAKADIRSNPLAHFIVNAIWLWDIKCVINGERWKRNNGKRIREWIETIGHIERLSSLSIIAFEHQAWPFPLVNDSKRSISARNIGHPLIPAHNNVGNDFLLNSETSTAIITGSNMSGKSTFLRTVAVNLILAYAGSPVCANEMECGLFDIYTSMRTRDNLNRNVSTFFSELLRIKTIINSVSTGKMTTFFIDEIFSGTNSMDRVTGAIAVLKTLQSKNSLGMISTHDLELCKLEKECEDRFVNYHFREYYEDNNIRFDYKLYKGPSDTKNAIYLIKMVGIPIIDA